MANIDAFWRIAKETEAGLIIRIAFSGECRGVDDARDAEWMANFARKVIDTEKPSAVVFDLTKLSFSAGDHIVCLAGSILNRDQQQFLPACIVATGRTAKSLEWFFQPNVIFGVAGMQLFNSLSQGIDFLKDRLTRSDA